MAENTNARHPDRPVPGEVKDWRKHGQFLKGIVQEFNWGDDDSVDNFMQVYRRFKNANFAHLTIGVSALYLIADQRTREPVANGYIPSWVAFAIT